MTQLLHRLGYVYKNPSFQAKPMLSSKRNLLNAIKL
ncbi:hypothetical protein [Nitrosomonas nitrosa]